MCTVDLIAMRELMTLKASVEFDLQSAGYVLLNNCAFRKYEPIFSMPEYGSETIDIDREKELHSGDWFFF